MKHQEITTYLAPRRLDEALQAMADGDATVLCGGTDLAPQTESGARQYKAKLLNIRRIEGLDGIETTGDEIRIGAAVTISAIRRSAALAEIAPVLVEAAERFASEQIRNAASVGGNLCNASPAGDMSPPLLVLGASAELACWQGGAAQTRRVPLDQFFTGPGKTVKRP
jgi:CO/xanthine dehydrogenase FAD-binding subunit